MRRVSRGAFTLVEILIVVVILGILTAIVVPQFAKATEDAASMATLDQLTKVRRALAVYYVRSSSQYPNIQAGNGTWGQLVGPGYLKEPPRNMWVGGANEGVIILGNSPDPAYQSAHGWIWDGANGNLWAGSFDANDEPYPRP